MERSNEAAGALYKAGGFAVMPPTPQHAAFTTALKVAQKEPLLMFKRLGG